MRNEQDVAIETLRKLMKPEPVDLGKVPVYIGKALRKGMKAAGVSRRIMGQSNWVVVNDVVSYLNVGGLMDHNGVIKRGGKPFLVTEPYARPGLLQAAEKFAEFTGLHLRVEQVAWWNPGATVRIIFYLPEDEAVVMSGGKWFDFSCIFERTDQVSF